MSINEQLVDFISPPDFEFGKQRPRSCRYKIWPHAHGKGLVVYIPGFGGDLGSYTETFCRETRVSHRLNTMTVEYFCIYCRPNVGANIYFELEDVKYINALLVENGFVPSNDIAANLKSLGLLARQRGEAVRVNATLKPKHGEYQNFGLLAALDIIGAILDAVSKFEVDCNDIYLIGSSYGGYLANLVTKICPGMIKAVFDNSSWAAPNLSYVVGRELGKPEFLHEIVPGVIVGLHVLSPWTLKAGLPNSFAQEKAAIRSFTEEHVQLMAEQGGKNTAYLFYHGINDKIADTNEKIDMVNTMIKHGFHRVQMEIVESSDVDGVFIKHLEHGMGMSMLTFFSLAHSYVNQHFSSQFRSVVPQQVVYPSSSATYYFDYSQSPVRAKLIDHAASF